MLKHKRMDRYHGDTKAKLKEFTGHKWKKSEIEKKKTV